MRPEFIIASIGALLTASAVYAETSPQVPAATTPAEVTQPHVNVLMHPEYAKVIARTAYVWGWPMVNMINRARRHHAGARIRVCLNGVLPAAPRGQIAHAHRLHRSWPDLRDLPEPGCCLWPRLLLAR